MLSALSAEPRSRALNLTKQPWRGSRTGSAVDCTSLAQKEDNPVLLLLQGKDEPVLQSAGSNGFL